MEYAFRRNPRACIGRIVSAFKAGAIYTWQLNRAIGGWRGAIAGDGSRYFSRGLIEVNFSLPHPFS